jgi:hypothetical protein
VLRRPVLELNWKSQVLSLNVDCTSKLLQLISFFYDYREEIAVEIRRRFGTEEALPKYQSLKVWSPILVPAVVVRDKGGRGQESISIGPILSAVNTLFLRPNCG